MRKSDAARAGGLALAFLVGLGASPAETVRRPPAAGLPASAAATNTPLPSSHTPSPSPSAATADPRSPAAPPPSRASQAGSPAMVDNASHLYTLDGWGGIHPAGSSPALVSNTSWPGWDIARGLGLLPDGSGGYLLDGYGAVHTVGSAAPNQNGDYFGFDIARAVAVAPWSTSASASGWVLDGYGAIHRFGSAPNLSSPVYWPGWDIARGLVVLGDSTPDAVSGYVLDGFGGMHAFGAAPAVASSYWRGWDIARGVTLLPGAGTSSVGGYVLDGFGGVHPFGAAPTVGQSAYWPGWDIARGVTAWSGAPAGAPGGWVLDGFGALHPYGSAAQLSASAYWQGWDHARSIGSSANSSSGQNRAAATSRVLSVPYFSQIHKLSCEAATLQMALAAEGISASQDSILAAFGIDTRPAWRDSNGILHWGDPYSAFVGDPDGSETALTGYGVYFPPVARVAGQFGGHALAAGEGIAPGTIYQSILAGHPVLAWVSFDRAYHRASSYQAFDGRWVQFYPLEHAVTVVGVSADSVLVNDPIRGPGWWPKSQFEAAYATFDNMAVIMA